MQPFICLYICKVYPITSSITKDFQASIREGDILKIHKRHLLPFRAEILTHSVRNELARKLEVLVNSLQKVLIKAIDLDNFEQTLLFKIHKGCLAVLPYNKLSVFISI